MQQLNNDKLELQNLLATLLSSPSGKRELEKLLGTTLPKSEEEEKTRENKKQGKRSKKLSIFPPPYILRVRLLCNLCKSTTFDFFLMTWSEDIDGYKSKPLALKDIRFDSFEQARIYELVRTKPATTQWTNPTYIKSSGLERRDKILPVQNSRIVVQSCRACEITLSFLDKDVLVKKLIQKANKLNEVSDMAQSLKKLYEKGEV